MWILFQRRTYREIYTDFLTHRDYAGQATFPNAIDQAGNFAFRWNVTTFPFFWKNYYVNESVGIATVFLFRASLFDN